MSAKLRQQLLAALSSGTAEELAVLLQLILLLSTQNKNEPARTSTQPAQKGAKCKLYLHYLTGPNWRN